MKIALIIVGVLFLLFVLYLGISIYKFRKNLATYDPKKDSDKLIILNDNTFFSKIKTGVALVDFWAEWCQPCKIQGPIVSELAEEFHKKAKICKLDVEHNKKVAYKLNIRNIPTIIIFKNGKEVQRFIGLKPKNVLKKALLKYLS